MAKTAKTAAAEYDVHPGVAMSMKWVSELKQKSGRTLEGWIALVQKSGPKTETAARDWLKAEHNFGTNSAWWIAEKAFGRTTGLGEDTPEAYLATAKVYVEEQYAGSKAGLRPIFNELLRLGRALGSDVKVCPCKTMVPLYRNHVFAPVKPSSRTRMDFGLCLTPLVKAGKKLPARLIDTGGFKKKDRITHRIELGSTGDIDDFVRRWMQQAYDLDA